MTQLLMMLPALTLNTGTQELTPNSERVVSALARQVVLPDKGYAVVISSQENPDYRTAASLARALAINDQLCESRLPCAARLRAGTATQHLLERCLRDYNLYALLIVVTSRCMMNIAASAYDLLSTDAHDTVYIHGTIKID